VVFKISLIPTGFMGEMPAIGPQVETSGYKIVRPDGIGFWVIRVSGLDFIWFMVDERNGIG
jgi:hypothetical protein